MRIQIIIEDRGDNHVKVTYSPALADIVARALSEHRELLPVEKYCMVMADAVAKASQNLNKYDPKKIITPGGL